MYWFRRKYQQIERVLSYIPIIWRGYDFDYRSAIDVFQYQLKRTADFLESDKACTLSAKQRAKRLRTAIELMQKVYDENYAIECIERFEELYGKTSYEFIPLERNPDLYEIKTKNESAVDDEHQEVIDEIRKSFYELGDSKQERAHKLLWKFIEHNIRSWWD